MPLVRMIDPRGVEHDIEGAVGESVMSLAVRHAIPGIVGECGGSLACASCHVYVDDEWMSRATVSEGEDPESEEEMLELTASERELNSRLSCQIKLTDDLDGIVVRIAPEQF